MNNVSKSREYLIALRCVNDKYTYMDYVHYLALHHIRDRVSLKEYHQIQEELDQERIQANSSRG